MASVSFLVDGLILASAESVLGASILRFLLVFFFAMITAELPEEASFLALAFFVLWDFLLSTAFCFFFFFVTPSSDEDVLALRFLPRTGPDESELSEP